MLGHVVPHQQFSHSLALLCVRKLALLTCAQPLLATGQSFPHLIPARPLHSPANPIRESASEPSEQEQLRISHTLKNRTFLAQPGHTNLINAVICRLFQKTVSAIRAITFLKVTPKQHSTMDTVSVKRTCLSTATLAVLLVFRATIRNHRAPVQPT